MITRKEALASIEKALVETEKRLILSPKYGVYLHAEQQLSMMKSNLLSPISSIDNELIDIGVMAVKENLESSDPAYADILMLADYQFKKAYENA